jgi:hypothetical protein
MVSNLLSKKMDYVLAAEFSRNREAGEVANAKGLDFLNGEVTYKQITEPKVSGDLPLLGQLFCFWRVSVPETVRRTS